jgi:hypothetical protein
MFFVIGLVSLKISSCLVGMFLQIVKHEIRFKYNLTLRRFLEILVAVEKQKGCVCVCKRSYPSCKGHMPYYIVTLTCLSAPRFPTLSHKLKDFRKRVSNIKCFKFFPQILSETFLIFKKFQQDFITNVNRFLCNVRIPVVPIRFWCFSEFSLQTLEKFSNIKFYENPSSGNRVFPCGQTEGRMDRRDEANSLFSQFCKIA